MPTINNSNNHYCHRQLQAHCQYKLSITVAVLSGSSANGISRHKILCAHILLRVLNIGHKCWCGLCVCISDFMCVYATLCVHMWLCVSVTEYAPVCVNVCVTVWLKPGNLLNDCKLLGQSNEIFIIVEWFFLGKAFMLRREHFSNQISHYNLVCERKYAKWDKFRTFMWYFDIFIKRINK